MERITREEAMDALGRYQIYRQRETARSWLRGQKVKWILRGEVEKLNPNLDNSVPTSQARMIRDWAEEDPWIQERLDRVLLEKD